MGRNHREVEDNLTGTRKVGLRASGAPEVGPPTSGLVVVRGSNAAGVRGVVDSSRSMGRNHREVADNLTGTRMRIARCGPAGGYGPGTTATTYRPRPRAGVRHLRSFP